MIEDFKDKVAVVTGGASGIGRAMAERFAQEGMKIVLADIQQDALDKTVEEMKAAGIDVVGFQTDVSKPEAVQELADKTIEHFGKVHVLCNNAGVAVAGATWERTLADWEWVMGVNLYAVIYGIKSFVPIMIKQGEPAHIVNTASLAGLISGPGMATYNVTKHGVVTLSETLFHEFKLGQMKVGVSVLCPAWVKTGIVDSQRNRPDALSGDDKTAKMRPQEAMMEQMVRQFVEKGREPSEIAQLVFEAVRDDKFYILSHPEFMHLVEKRKEDILTGANPTYVPMA